MNRDVEENELKQLFRELRREDERLAPPFDGDWNAALSRTDAALSRMNEGHSPRRTFRLAAATAIALILVGGSALILFKWSSKRPISNATAESVATQTQPHSPSVAPIETPSGHIENSNAGRNQLAKVDSKTSGPDSKTGSARERSKSARRRVSARSQTTVALVSRTTVTLISRWRSPTEFLLNSPGEQLLKTVPRLNESLLDIKAVTPDVNN